MALPYVLVVAGHRTTDRVGNAAETNLTDDIARETVSALRGAGFDADWFQRDLDNDTDPDDTVGTLDTVALGCARILDRIPDGQLGVMLDMHYNGTQSPFHVIVPETTGLRTAYQNGTPSNDVPAVNTLDMKVAAAICNEAAKASGYELFRSRYSPGIMSEQQSGVGGQGYRLAMFAATARNRAKAVRLIVEHGGTGMKHASNAKLWANVHLKALQSVFDDSEDESEQEPESDAAPLPDPEKINTLIDEYSKRNNYRSPLSGMGGTIIDLGEYFGIHPAVFVAFAARETQLGTDSTYQRYEKHNFGWNKTGSGDQVTGTAEPPYFDHNGSRYSAFADAFDGIEGFFKTLNRPVYKDTGGRLTDIMEIYSPSFENDNENGLNIFRSIGDKIGTPIDADFNIYVLPSDDDDTDSTDDEIELSDTFKYTAAFTVGQGAATLRRKPTTESEIIENYSPGTDVHAVGYAHGQNVHDSDIWIAVNHPQTGWMHVTGISEKVHES